ncbi:SCO-spondin [Lingula anatina]|uniref:SCO-spondin n=1 Tax=Lingula anatina TaxID=7574 RepID=A0A1S3HS80_LINAN|nr:SCO-spondin [Lingula anatina]|eukprot:XP_013387914.1 SCO-spondin [Lingula anatina]
MNKLVCLVLVAFLGYSQAQYTDAGFGPWTEWSCCSATCGDGKSVRTRECLGSECDGPCFEVRNCNDGPCPVDGGWSEWTDWMCCSKTCGGGETVRQRFCNSPAPLNGGKDCEGPCFEIKPCNTHECPAPCVCDTWSAWGQCSASCGSGGLQTRIRSCTGNGCLATDYEMSQPCYVQECPIPCTCEETWGVWSQCSVSCGGGSRTRSRSCTDGLYGGRQCVRSDYEQTEICNSYGCPIPCQCETWAAWGTCSATCGGGQQVRKRSCTDGINGGRPCTPSDYQENRLCNVYGCPVGCSCQEWGEWEQCSASCGGGEQTRRRSCTDGIFGGRKCTIEDYQETRQCNSQSCTVPCTCGVWSSWTQCSMSCGVGGTRTKTRVCTGDTCIPSDYQITQPCGRFPCPVPCTCGIWAAWSQCSVSCGGGLRVRSRTCTEGQYGGRPCVSSDYQQTDICNTKVCPVDCKCGDWNPWNACSASCGPGGVQLRTRSCTDGQYGGRLCQASDYEESRACINNVPCPVDCTCNDWAPWSTCSASCGPGGVETRTRTCQGGAFGGRQCQPSDYKQTRECVNNVPCAIDCTCNDWTPWSKCSASCGPGGVETRTRSCQDGLYGGRLCLPTDYKEQRACVNNVPCAVDCKCGDWTPWSKCSASCGPGGVETRTRSCQDGLYGGKLCLPTDYKQERACVNNVPCAVDCKCGDWAPWSKCSVSCGPGGVVTRTRSCQDGLYGGRLCLPTDYKEERACILSVPCAVDCKCGDWTPWSTCSASCGPGGVETRTRSCQDGLYGGKLCLPTDYKQERTCVNNVPCAVDCTCNDWAPWSTCSASCGPGGVETRTRSCQDGLYGGKLCLPSDYKETRVCLNTVPCAIDCTCNDWTPWSKCSASCGPGGVETRTRSCQDGLYGGKLCLPTDYKQERACVNNVPCAVPCTCEAWSQWSTCSVSCGGGIQARSRSCQDGTNGGRLCGASDYSESRACNSGCCPQDCTCGAWEAWTPCSATCGGGSRSRSRLCYEAKCGGRQCSDADFMQVDNSCNAVDCGDYNKKCWSDWSAWTTCSATCNGGIRSRTRNCICPTPSVGGRDLCDGPTEEQSTCNSQSCDAVSYCDMCIDRRNGPGHYWDPEDCSKFYHCYRIGGKTVSYHKRCPRGLFWDQEKLTCVFCEEAKCRYVRQPGPPNCDNIDPCPGGFEYDSANCAKYYECSNNKWIPHCCPPGQGYDPDTFSCSASALCSSTCSVEPPNPDLGVQCVSAAGWKKWSHPTYDHKYSFYWHGSIIPFECHQGHVFNIDLCECVRKVDNVCARQCVGEEYLACFTFDKDFSEAQERTWLDSLGLSISTTGGIKTQCGQGAAYFNGKGHAEIPRFTAHEFGTYFTISLWFRQTDSGLVRRSLVSNGDCFVPGTIDVRTEEDASGATGAGLVTYTKNYTLAYQHVSASLDVWHHAVMTYDGAYIRYYMDGVMQTPAVQAYGAIKKTNTPLIFGRDFLCEDSNFVGFMDEIKIIARTLNDAEVAALFAERLD